MYRYTITTEKPVRTLRYLRHCLLLACEWAVGEGDAEPAKVLAEVRGALGTLQDRWRDKRRHEVLQLVPSVPMRPEGNSWEP